MKISLYSNCKLVVGAYQSAILDLSKDAIFFVHNKVRRYIDTDISSFSDFEKAEFYQCAGYLLQEQLAYVSDPIFFGSKLSTQVSCYSKISNCSLLISSTLYNELAMQKLAKVLDESGVRALLIVAAPQVTVRDIKNVLSFFENSKARAFEIVLSFSQYNDVDETELICNGRIIAVYFYGSPSNKVENFTIYEGIKKQYTDVVYEQLLKWNDIEAHLTVNTSFYTESLKFNPFYYKRRMVDCQGNIYRDLSYEEIVGNILSDDLYELGQTDKFEFVTVPKSKISVCKQCELRNACPDNRVPQKRQNNSWYHVTECKYNPYIAKWQHEDGYKTLAECGVNNVSVGFSIDRKKLDQVILEVSDTYGNL